MKIVIVSRCARARACDRMEKRMKTITNCIIHIEIYKLQKFAQKLSFRLEPSVRKRTIERFPIGVDVANAIVARGQNGNFVAVNSCGTIVARVSIYFHA